MLQLSLQSLSLLLTGCRSLSEISLLLVSLLQPLPQLADLVPGSTELCQRVRPGNAGLLPQAVQLCHCCVCLLHSGSQLLVELCQLRACPWRAAAGNLGNSRQCITLCPEVCCARLCQGERCLCLGQLVL